MRMAARHRDYHSGDEEGLSGLRIKICDSEDSLHYGPCEDAYYGGRSMQYNPNNRLHANEHGQIYDHESKLSIIPALRETPNLSISIKRPTAFLSSPYTISADWPYAYYYEPMTPNRLTLPGPSSDSSSPYSADAYFFSDNGSLHPESDTISIYSPSNGSVFDKSPTTTSNGCLLDDHLNYPDTTRSSISTDDIIMLLSAKLGPQDLANLDPRMIRQQFSKILSIANDESFGSKTRSQKPMKARVSSSAGRAASSLRRKNTASFVCELEACNGSFTRKNGLLNHYKAHLGIADKICQFCGQGFTTSLSRHEKNCKQKSQVGSLQQPEPSLFRMDPRMFGGMSP